MEKKYVYIVGVVILIVGLAMGYVIGRRQGLNRSTLNNDKQPAGYAGEATPRTTVPGYSNPFSTYKNPFRSE